MVAWHLPLLWILWVWQMSQVVPDSASFLHNKVAISGHHKRCPLWHQAKMITPVILSSLGMVTFSEFSLPLILSLFSPMLSYRYLNSETVSSDCFTWNWIMNLVPVLILCTIYIYIYFRQNSLLAGRIIYVLQFSPQQVNSMRIKE